MKTIRCFHIALFLFGTVAATAQTNPVDSLKALLLSDRTDVQRAQLLLDISQAYSSAWMLDSGLHYARNAAALGEQTRQYEIQAQSIALTAKLLGMQGLHARSIEQHTAVRNLYHQHGMTYDTFRWHVSMAIGNNAAGNPGVAMAHLDTVAQFAKRDNPTHQMVHARIMANVLNLQQRYQDAIPWRHRALAMARVAGNPEDQLRRLYELGAEHGHLQATDSALYYFQLALPLSLNKSDPFMEMHTRANIGICLVKKGRYADAAAFLKAAQAIQVNLDEGDCCGYAAYYALALQKTGKTAEAEKYLRQAENDIPAPEYAVARKLFFTAMLAVFEEQGNYPKALWALKQLNAAEDTLASRKHQLYIADMEVRYQTREQEAEIIKQEARLTRQRAIILVVLALAALAGGLAFQYRRISRERKQAAALIEQQNRALANLDAAKSRFFANISHEFRTPLTLILAPLEPAMAVVKELTLRNQLQAAQRSARQLLQLVDELLDLSRLEAGKLQLQLADIPLNAWLRQRLAGFESLAASRKIKLRFESASPETLILRLDAGKTEKILNNLLGNALKFSEKGAEVQISVAWQEQQDGAGLFTIKVSDNGPGIHADDLPHIFDRFFQGTHQQQSGAGIGLALSRELAQYMDGTLHAESDWGKGSVFTLTIPAVVGEAPTADVAEIPGAVKAPVITPFKPGADRGKAVVLVVEDNPDLRRYLEETLGAHFQVVLAEDGSDALQRLKREHVDLIVSDVMMPRMDGFALLEAVRGQQAVFQQIPFILLTARALNDDRLQGFQLGVDDYISKPFDPGLLIARIQNLLQLRQKRQKWDQPRETTSPDNADLTWLKKAEKIVADRIDDPDLNIEALAKALAQSTRNLDRTLKRLSGFTPVEFIREIRLQRAWQLLEQKRFSSVAEVRQAVGIENPAWFSRIFTQRFGIGPRELLGRGD